MSSRPSLLPLPQCEALQAPPGVSSLMAACSIETPDQDAMVIGGTDGIIYIVSAAPPELSKPYSGIVHAKRVVISAENGDTKLLEVPKIQCLVAFVHRAAADTSSTGELRVVIVVASVSSSGRSVVRVLEALTGNGIPGMWFRSPSSDTPDGSTVLMRLVRVTELPNGVMPLSLLPPFRSPGEGHEPALLMLGSSLTPAAASPALNVGDAPPSVPIATPSMGSSGSTPASSGRDTTAHTYFTFPVPAPTAALVALDGSLTVPLLWPTSNVVSKCNEASPLLCYGISLTIKQAAPAPVLSLRETASCICPSTKICVLGCVDGSIIVVGLRISSADGSHGGETSRQPGEEGAGVTHAVWQAFILSTLRGAGAITKIVPYAPKVRLGHALPLRFTETLLQADVDLTATAVAGTTKEGEACFVVVDSSGKVLVMFLCEQPSPDEMIATTSSPQGSASENVADIELDVLEISQRNSGTHRGGGSCIVIQSFVDLLPDYVALVETKYLGTNTAVVTPSSRSVAAALVSEVTAGDAGSTLSPPLMPNPEAQTFKHEKRSRRQGGPVFVAPFPGLATGLQKFVKFFAKKPVAGQDSASPHPPPPQLGSSSPSSDANVFFEKATPSMGSSAPIGRSLEGTQRKNNLMIPSASTAMFGRSPGQPIPETAPILSGDGDDEKLAAGPRDAGRAPVTHQTGALLGMGPISVSVADVDGDGLNELIVTTLGRFVAFYHLCNAHPYPVGDASRLPRFVCMEAVEMPTHLYDCRLLRLHHRQASCVWVLCGPSHVMVQHHNLLRNVIVARAHMLLQLLRDRQVDMSIDT